MLLGLKAKLELTTIITVSQYLTFSADQIYLETIHSCTFGCPCLSCRKNISEMLLRLIVH